MHTPQERPSPREIGALIDAGAGADRVYGLAEGVFGFSMTLLASTIVIPELSGVSNDAALPEIAGELVRAVLNYAQIFLMTAILWFSFHRNFRFIQRYDRKLQWLVLLLLLQVALIPFLAQLADRYDGNMSTAIFFFAFALSGFCDSLIWRHASHNHRLVDPELDRRIIGLIALQSVVPDLFFLLCGLIALTISDGFAGMVFTCGVLLVTILRGPYLRLLTALTWR